jgi:succinyl-diaminopimelate desuccinylase
VSIVAEIAQALIACPSITPNDAGCQQIIAERLKALGFKCEKMRFGDVDNLWARRGSASPLLVFAGHTDVVPPGPEKAWTSPPFNPTIRDGILYGRGATDMKGAIAAMITAVEKFLAAHHSFSGSLGFLITSDEEGPAINGTKKVIEALQQRGEHIDYCIVGEASSEKHLGDQARVGRRGSLHGKLTLRGKQGHVANPHLAKNPIHLCFQRLNEMVQTSWDKGNEHFPQTSFQITNIHAGTGALNVIPGELTVDFNFRFSNALTPDALQQRVEHLFRKHGLDFHIDWSLSALPFLSKQGKLTNVVKLVCKDVTGQDTHLSTGGGTSDARFIAPTGTEVIELGVCNATAHHVDEHVSMKDLESLAKIYERVLVQMFC